MYHAIQAPRAPAGGDDAPEPPSGLSDQAAEVWTAMTSEWRLGAEELLLLQGGLEAWDQYREARAQLREEGSVVVSESGSAKRHPAALVARDAFREYRDVIRQLGLETAVQPEEQDNGR